MHNKLFLLTLMLSAGVQAQTTEKGLPLAVESHLVPMMKQLSAQYGDSMTLLSSRDVPRAMLAGKSRVGISSRKWTDKEVAQFRQLKGYRPTELYFTADVVAILANEDNPNTAITVSDIKKVFGCNKEPEYVRWVAWEDDEQAPYMKPYAVDGVFDMHRRFNSWITCSEGSFSATQYLAEDDDLVDKMDDEEEAVSFVTYSDKWDSQKMLSIIDRRGERYNLNKETILSGRYPLSSVYYMYLDKPPHHDYLTESEKGILGLTYSDKHKEVLNQFGFISLPEEAIHRNRVKLGLDQPQIEGGYK